MRDRTRVLVLGLGCLGLGLANLATLLTRPSLLVVLVAWASAAMAVVGVVLLFVDAWPARRAASAPAPRVPLRALDQAEYAALLRGDVARWLHFGMVVHGRPPLCVRCRRAARQVAIRHPIWDGPFEEAGSGSVDVRRLFWCVGCDGEMPLEDGPPVRLPFLDNLPIRLLPELYKRLAFRSLPDPVECYVPPPPAPAEGAAPDKETQP